MKKKICYVTALIFTLSLLFTNLDMTYISYAATESTSQNEPDKTNDETSNSNNNEDNELKVNYNPILQGKSNNFLSLSNEQNSLVESKSETNTLHPIIILIKFKDEPETTYSQTTINSIKNAYVGKTKSMKDYLSKVSCNNFSNIDPLFTFDADNDNSNIFVYEDKYPKGYYMPYSNSNPEGYKTTKEEILRFQLYRDAFVSIKDKIPSDLNIDTDGDGYVDIVNFFTSAEGKWSDFLWPSDNAVRDDENVTTVNGAKLKEFNLYTMPQFTKYTYILLAHEFLHYLNFPDMYPYDKKTDPARKWTIMSNGDGYPTVYERMKYGKWIDEENIPVISENNTYNISDVATNPEEKTIACRINVPNSKEYFMVEYRNKRADVYENHIPYTGLLVYRINPERNGDEEGDPELYILRNKNIGNAALTTSADNNEIKLTLQSGEDTGYKIKLNNLNGHDAQFTLENNNKPEISIDSSKGSEMCLGDTTNLNMKASGINGYFKYTVLVNDKNILDNSSNESISWKPEAAGTYNIKVKVCDGKGYENETSYNINVHDFKLSCDKASPVSLKDNINFSLDVLNGNKDDYTYAYGLIINGQDYLINDYSINTSGSISLKDINSSDLKPGAVISLYCDIKDASSNVVRRTTENITINKMEVSSLNADSNAPQLINTNISLNAVVNDEINSENNTHTYTITKENSNNESENLNASLKDNMYIANWAPKESGLYIITFTCTDEFGQSSSKEITYEIVEESINKAIIYFKNNKTPYMQYKVDGSSFNSMPGDRIKKDTSLEGYNYKGEINLKYKNSAKVFFNTGNIFKDLLFGREYTLEGGCYTYENGKLAKIEDTNSKLIISKFEANNKETKPNEQFTLCADTINKHGNVKYKFTATNKSNNESIILQDFSENSTCRASLSEIANYTLSVEAIDDSSYRIIKNIDYEVTEEENKVVIYYKGFMNPHLFYKIGNESWSNFPGVSFEKTSDLEGFNYKIVIDLNDSKYLTACFNNGNFLWDTNFLRAYKFTKGTYTYYYGDIKCINH